MTRATTSPEHVLMQAGRQGARVKVLVDQPAVVFQAQVYAAPTSPDGMAQVIFYNVTVGAYTDILPDMTLLIGSTAGGWDVGVARVRLAADALSIYIGETSEIVLEDDDYLTVVNAWEPWARHPRTLGDELYMDYSVAYTGQHASPTPVPVMGLDAVVELTGAEVEVDFDWSDSWVPGGGAITYFSACATASGVTGNTSSTPSFTFNTSGRHVVSCTVTSGGVSYTGYRCVYVLDDDYWPLLEARIEGLQEDVEAGGTSFDMTVYGDLATVRPGAKVLVFTEEFLDLVQVEQSPETDRENMLFSGWVLGESTGFGTRQRTRFEVAGPAGFLDAVQASPMALQDTDFADNGGGAASDWGEYNGLTVPAALWHYFMWRSSLPRLTDIRIMTDTRETGQVVTTLDSMWAQLTDIAWRTIFARPLCNRYGQIYVEIDPQMESTTVRNTLPVVMDIERADMLDEPEILYNTTPEIGKVVLTGFQYSGGASAQYGGLAPGNIHGRFGGFEQIDECVFSSQQNAIDLAGRYWGWKSNPYPEINLTLAQVNKFIDIAPRQYCTLTVTAEENNRGLELNNVRVLPRRISYRLNPNGGMRAECSFEAEASLGHGVAYVFPVIPEVEPPEDPVTPPTPPSNPPPPTEEEPPVEEETEFSIAWACGEPDTGNKYVWYSDDFNINGAQPTWTQLGGDTLDTPVSMVVSHSNPQYAFILDTLGEGGSAPSIVRATPVGGLQTCLTNTLARNTAGEGAGSLVDVTIDPVTNYVYAMLWVYGIKGSHFYILRSQNWGVSWQSGPIVTAIEVNFNRLVVRDGRCWIANNSLYNKFMAYMNFGAAVPTVNTLLGTSVYYDVALDPTTASQVWVAFGGEWNLATAAGSMVMLTPRNPLYLGSPISLNPERKDYWIDPTDGNHQRMILTHGGNRYVHETTDGWLTIAETSPALPVLTLPSLCQAGWSTNYTWYGIGEEANCFVWADMASNTPIHRMGANTATPPYTDAIPQGTDFLDFGGFWAGTTE